MAQTQQQQQDKEQATDRTAQVLVSKELHRRLRRLAAERDTTVLALVNEAVEKFLDNAERHAAKRRSA